MPRTDSHHLRLERREAEAAAIEARAKALGTNPNLVTLVQAERWNGVLPTTMGAGLGGAVCFGEVRVG